MRILSKYILMAVNTIKMASLFKMTSSFLGEKFSLVSFESMTSFIEISILLFMLQITCIVRIFFKFILYHFYLMNEWFWSCTFFNFDSSAERTNSLNQPIRSQYGPARFKEERVTWPHIEEKKPQNYPKTLIFSLKSFWKE